MRKDNEATSETLEALSPKWYIPTLYVADATKNQILWFRFWSNSSGIFIPSGLGGLNFPQGLLGTWPHDLLVASSGGNAILKYDWHGNFVSDFVPPGSGGLTGPVSLDYGPGPNYDVYVSVYRGGVLRYARSVNQWVRSSRLKSSSLSRIRTCNHLVNLACGGAARHQEGTRKSGSYGDDL